MPGSGAQGRKQPPKKGQPLIRSPQQEAVYYGAMTQEQRIGHLGLAGGIGAMVVNALTSRSPQKNPPKPRHCTQRRPKGRPKGSTDSAAGSPRTSTSGTPPPPASGRGGSAGRGSEGGRFERGGSEGGGSERGGSSLAGGATHTTEGQHRDGEFPDEERHSVRESTPIGRRTPPTGNQPSVPRYDWSIQPSPVASGHRPAGRSPPCR